MSRLTAHEAEWRLVAEMATVMVLCALMPMLILGQIILLLYPGPVA